MNCNAMEEEFPGDGDSAFVSYRIQLAYIAEKTSQNCQNFLRRIIQICGNCHKDQMASFKIEDFFCYDKIVTASTLCAKILHPGTPAFKCLECMNQENSIICMECFDRSDHAGHNFQKINVFGGCCDCGDDEKWKPEGSCSSHTKREEQIVLDQQKTQKFVKQMKFLFYVILRGYHTFRKDNDKVKYDFLVEILAVRFVTFLKNFNVDSLVSNQMTSMLFLQSFSHDFSDISSVIDNQAIKVKGNYILELILEIRIGLFENTLVELFTSMFSKIEFKEELTLSYARALVRNPDIMTKDISQISCQVFTSHKIIRKLMESGKFPILHIRNLKKTLKFEQIANYFCRFFIDIQYLSNLYNETGLEFLKYQFSQGTILTLSGYQDCCMLPHCANDSINYYGIEDIYLKYLFPILKKLNHQKQLLKKMMKDLLQEIKKSPPHSESLYLTSERTFLVCLLVYCEGDLTRGLDRDLLMELELIEEKSPGKYELTEVLLMVFERLVHVFKMYGTFLSSRETVERFYTFYAFSFERSFKIVSIDQSLFKYCLLIVKILAQEQHLHEKLLNPLQTILLISKQLHQFPSHHESNYDRKKAMGIWMDYLGMLAEISYLDHSEISLKCMLDLCSLKEMQFFYCGLLASLQPIKIDELTRDASLFLGDTLLFFEEFIKSCAEIDSNKIVRLKEPLNKEFPPYNFSYIKSKKNSSKLSKCRNSNLNVIASRKQESAYKFQPYSSPQYPISLKKTIFGESLIKKIISFTSRYFRQLLNSNDDVKKADFIYFTVYLEEILKLYKVVQEQSLLNLLLKIVEIDEAKKYINDGLIQSITSEGRSYSEVEISERSSEKLLESSEEQERKKVMEQMKRKKMEKFKAKQRIVMENFKEEEKMIDESEEKRLENPREGEEICCMICKIEEDSKTLALMSFFQESTTFHKNYLNSKRKVILITTCNHVMHQECYMKIYGNRQYVFCNFCKRSCNLLLSLDKKFKGTQIREDQEELISQNAVDSLERIEIATGMIKTSRQEYLHHSKQQKSKSSTIEIKEEEDDEELTIDQRALESLAVSILYRAIIDEQSFISSQLLSSIFLYTNLKNKQRKGSLAVEPLRIRKVVEEDFEDSKKQGNFDEEIQMFRECYKQVLELLVVGILEAEKEQQLFHIRRKCIPAALLQNIRDTFGMVSKHSAYSLLMPPKFDPIREYRPLRIRHLPQKLEDLSSEVGECPNCHRKTNQISLCLLCPDFKSCVGCQVFNLTKHAYNTHAGASIFIRTDSGYTIFIGNAKKWIYQSIYKNFLLEPYVPGKKEEKSKYTLNEEAYHKLETVVRRHRIEQDIRYAEISMRPITNRNGQRDNLNMVY